MLNSLIEKYKNYRKQTYLNALGNYKYRYAFIGTGHHSITNLYPSLENMNVPLQFICSRQISNAQKLSQRFPGAVATSNIEDVLRSPDVKGLFISTPPALHYTFVRKALEAGKHIFVEKPPCNSLSELKELITLQKDCICMTGLQKRFSAITKLIKRHKLASKVQSYNYRYCTGPYPEGDAITQLFIHPLDNILQLFGPVESITIQKSINGHGVIYQLLTRHTSGVPGITELSTLHSWREAGERLEINNQEEIIEASYPDYLISFKKPTVFLKVPVDKILKQPSVQKIYLNNKGFAPIADSNSLMVQGFYPELKHFLALAESGKNDHYGKLESLLPLYQLMEKLKAAG